jgi:hypothetical protein
MVIAKVMAPRAMVLPMMRDVEGMAEIVVVRRSIAGKAYQESWQRCRGSWALEKR